MSAAELFAAPPYTTLQFASDGFFASTQQSSVACKGK